MTTVNRCLAWSCALAFARALSAEAPDHDGFARVLEKLRTAARIPGMSAAVVKNGRVVLQGGFGFANLEKRIAAKPDTPYNIANRLLGPELVADKADVEKAPFAAALLEHFPGPRKR